MSVARVMWIIVEGHKYLLDFEKGEDKLAVVGQIEADLSGTEGVATIKVLNEERLPMNLSINLASRGPVFVYAGGDPKPSEIG